MWTNFAYTFELLPTYPSYDNEYITIILIRLHIISY